MPVPYSKIVGKGQPLLILHGFLGMGDNWKTLANHYAKNGFEAHLLDQRNHGRSFWSETFHYKALSEDLWEYVMHHGITDAHILGHSMGGKTAMQFACSHAPLTRSLIVADIAPKYYPPHHKTILDALGKLDLDNIRSRSAADRELAQYLPEAGTRQFLLKNLYRREENQFALRCNLEVLRHKMPEIGGNIDRTDRFEGATLFLRGDRSTYISDGDEEAIRTHFPVAILDTITNAGHWLHAENPLEFLKKSLEFLNS
ncbi:MAG: alpha/beta fold hydrolase [Bacteroidota bacterium]